MRSPLWARICAARRSPSIPAVACCCCRPDIRRTGSRRGRSGRAGPDRSGFPDRDDRRRRPSGAGGALTAVIEDLADRPESLDAVVWTVCADDDGAFRQPTARSARSLPPTTSLTTTDGQEQRFRLPPPRGENRIRFIREQYGLSDDEALTVLAAVHLYDRTWRCWTRRTPVTPTSSSK